MADSNRFKVKVEDATYKVTAPDEATAWKWANAEHAKSVKTITANPEKVEPSKAEKIAGNPFVRFALGAADPFIGGAQKVANFTPAFRGPTFQEIITDKKPTNEVASFLNNNINQLDSMIDRGRSSEGVDIPRMGGAILSPANAGIAKALPNSTSILGRATTGAIGGATGAVTAPVNTSNGSDVASTTGAQSLTGAAAGAILGPVLGKVADVVAPKVLAWWNNIGSRAEVTGARASMEADSVILNALKEVGAKVDDLSKAEMQSLRTQVIESMKSGKKLDAAALMRSEDFKKVGIDPLRGWITRDSNQFAREKNLRGVPGVGEPIMGRMDEGNRKVQQLVAQLRGEPAEPYQAGVQIKGALQGFDKPLKDGVNSEYAMARDHLGRAAPVDHVGFSTKANAALDEGQLGHYLPAEVKGILNDVTSGKTPFNVNTMTQIDTVLSAAQRSAGKGTPQSLAIGKVRDALNSSSIADNVGEDAKRVFDSARGKARERFSLHESMPALKAAVDDDAPDNFVRNYIIGGKVDEVKRLAETLKNSNPDAFNQAKAQIGEKIARAAFGENVTADKLASPERLAAALRTIGTDKLSAFYSPQEIEQFKRLSRVSAYMNSKPNDAPVNTSNNIQAMISILTKIPGVPTTVALGSAAKNAVQTRFDAQAALNAKVPSTPNLTEEQQKALSKALLGLTAGAGVSSGLALR